MKDPRIISLFRYSLRNDKDTDCFAFYNRFTKEEHLWNLIDNYPADEFLYDEKLDETTIDRCGLQFLRWLAEEDNLQAADFIMLPTPFAVAGLLVVNEKDDRCKKIKDLYKKFFYVGKLRGTPFTIRKFETP